MAFCDEYLFDPRLIRNLYLKPTLEGDFKKTEPLYGRTDYAYKRKLFMGSVIHYVRRAGGSNGAVNLMPGGRLVP
jgi:hypothetical protein